nr:hemin uptake protein HemP [uncultured Albidiferax sp.]
MYATLSARPQFNPTSGENANSVLQGVDLGKAKPASAVESRDLLKGQKAVEIMHNGCIYRLQNTKLGKLILTK